jgi:GTP pyrophosphokinase
VTQTKQTLEIEQQFLAQVKVHFSDADLPCIRNALDLARSAHEGQRRKHGEPYLHHPLRVAIRLLRDFGVHENDAISAALLHDVLEDAGDSYRDAIKSDCGRNVLQWVQILTAPDVPQHADNEEHSRRKVERVSSGPPSVWIIKLVDRIDNLEDALRLDDNETNRAFWHRYERDTRLNYVPLAHRLGRTDVSAALGRALAALAKRVARAEDKEPGEE